MKCSLLFFAAALMSYQEGGPPKKEIHPDVLALQGTWDVVDQEPGIPPIITFKLVITAEKITWYALLNGQQGVGDTSYKLDPAAKPKRLDFSHVEGRFKGQVHPGIYDLQGDILKICYQGPEGQRPAAFVRKGSNALFVLKRQKAAAAPTDAAGQPQRLAKFRDFIQHLHWSPDGKQFLVTRVPPGKMGIWTMNADGGDLKAILPKEPMPHFDGHWSPDGKRIVFVFDRLQGTDGKLQIDVIDADGQNHKTLLPHKAFDEAPRWSPDGKRIAWCSTRDKNQDIWTCDADGKDLKRLTSDPNADNAPTWSPDGKRIAFTSGRAGNLDIWVMNADGADQRNLTSSSVKMDYWPAWSPDGKHIAFTSNRTGNYEIFVMDADGSNPRNLSNHPGVDNFATWGPDGRLAWISNRAGTYDVLAVDVNRLR